MSGVQLLAEHLKKAEVTLPPAGCNADQGLMALNFHPGCRLTTMCNTNQIWHGSLSPEGSPRKPPTAGLK